MGSFHYSFVALAGDALIIQYAFERQLQMLVALKVLDVDKHTVHLVNVRFFLESRNRLKRRDIYVTSHQFNQTFSNVTFETRATGLRRDSRPENFYACPKCASFNRKSWRRGRRGRWNKNTWQGSARFEMFASWVYLARLPSLLEIPEGLRKTQFHSLPK